MSKKSIAVIGLKGIPAYGGAAAVGENIIEELKNQYNFTVYAISSHTDKSTGKYNGYNLIVFISLFITKLNIIYYYTAAAVHALLFSNYDLIHLHHRDASFILILLKLKYKVILTTHGMVLTSKWSRYSKIFNIQDKIFLSFADIITCVSKKDKSIVEKKVNQSIVHIPNGIRLKMESANNYNSRKYLMFSSNRIIPSKGCHVFLNAMKNINWNYEILIAGDLNHQLEYKNELLQLSKHLNDVKFLGLIKNKNELEKYILNSKLFVYPSEIESMSMMLLEVAALKTPIICCDIPENKDIFEDDEVIYFKKNNVIDLSQKINWALNNYELIKRKAEKAFNKLKDHYLWKDIALQYKKVYDQLLD
ncbi:glycosyltransferase family 4 protein [Calditrichota bacterium]